MSAAAPTSPPSVSKISNLVLFLPAVAVCSNLIYPGEVFPQSRFLLLQLSALACLIVFLRATAQGVSKGMLRDLAEAFLPLLCLLPTLLLGVSAARSQETWVLFFSYSCLYFSARTLRVTSKSLVACFLGLTVVAFWIELQALHQAWFGFEELKEEVSRAAGLEPDFRSALLARIASGRVFAQFSLPNSLAGFLTMILPLNLLLIFLAFSPVSASLSSPWLVHLIRSPWIRMGLIVQLLLLITVLGLTQSFGGWVCCVGSLGLTTLFWLRGNLRRKKAMIFALAVFVAAAAAAMSWISQRRGFSLWNLSASENPISLRWISFTTAWKIFEDYPLVGVGLGNYGLLNPRYQQSPALVTQYAHNTPLQLLAEGGMLFMAAAALVFLLAWNRLKGETVPSPGLQPATLRSALNMSLFAALAAWAIHNCLDVSLYLPSLGGLGFFLAGLFASPGFRGVFERHDFSERTRNLIRAICVAGLLLPPLLATKIYLSQTFASLALDHANTGQVAKAQRLACWASWLNRADARAVVLESKIKAQASLSDRRSLLLTLKEGLERAVVLDPFNAEYHYELSRIYAGLGEAELSRRALAHAHAVFPSDPRFQLSDKSN